MGNYSTYYIVAVNHVILSNIISYVSSAAQGASESVSATWVLEKWMVINESPSHQVLKQDQ